MRDWNTGTQIRFGGKVYALGTRHTFSVTRFCRRDRYLSPRLTIGDRKTTWRVGGRCKVNVECALTANSVLGGRRLDHHVLTGKAIGDRNTRC